jgi:transcription antitermination factor NusG
MMQNPIFSEAPAIGETEPALLLGSRPRTQYSEPHWYAAYTCANHEKRVAHQLQQHSLECFLPLCDSVRRWKDRRVRLQLPLFPGYVFVRFPPQERLRVLEIPSLVRLVGFNGVPSPLSSQEIEVMRNVQTCRLRAVPHRYLKVGRRVRIIRGPLEGCEGILLREKSDFRVVLSVDLIMRSVAVEVGAEDIVTVSGSNIQTASTCLSPT